jgi:hypothetical protein
MHVAPQGLSVQAGGEARCSWHAMCAVQAPAGVEYMRKSFEFLSLGIMAYVGSDKALTQVRDCGSSGAMTLGPPLTPLLPAVPACGGPAGPPNARPLMPDA